MAAGAGTLPHGLPLRVFTGLAVASVATLLVAVIWLAEPGPPAVEHDPGDVVRVGVVEGQSVPGYLTSSRGELDAMVRSPGVTDTWALVSLSGYLPPDRLMPVFGGVAVAQVYARAPLRESSQVERISVYRMPDDVVAGMLHAAVRRDQERADYQQLSNGLVGGGANETRLRQAYASAARLAADEADAYRARCSCVFAAVVRAAPATLTAIAGRDGVRAVDPAPEVRALDHAEFRPPLPEQPVTPQAAAPAPVQTVRTGASAVAPSVSTPLPSSSGTRARSASVPSASAVPLTHRP
jgi:hypothetical protein